MPSCLDFFRERNHLKTGHPISTLDLKNLIDTCASDERATLIITALTKEKPLGSNYVIRLSDETVDEIHINELHASVFTIGQHIKFKNLESCCKLFLSLEQFNYVIQLDALKNELVTTVKPTT